MIGIKNKCVAHDFPVPIERVDGKVKDAFVKSYLIIITV